MKLGVSLAGGGIKGIAHIGAIKALEEEGIKIDYISGTSSGSIVASLYAAGYTTDEMYKIFKNYAKSIRYFDTKNVLKFCKDLIIHHDIRITGLNSGTKIYNLAKDVLSKKGIKYISDVKIPLLIPALNIRNEELYVFYSKDVSKMSSQNMKYINRIELAGAIRASCSYPGVFSPYEYKSELLVDGGITENIPWSELKRVGADKVLSITFENVEGKKCCNNLFEVLDKSFSVMCKELAKHEVSGTDYLIEIQHNNIGLLETKCLDELYQEGYKQTKNKLKLLKLN